MDDDIVKSAVCPLCGKKMRLLTKPLHSKGQRYTFHYGCEKDGDMFLTLKLLRNFNETWRARLAIEKVDDEKIAQIREALEKSVIRRRSRRKSPRPKRKITAPTTTE